MPPMTQLDAATWCRHLVPDGSVYAFLADHRHQLFPAELFADLVRQGGGHPSVPAEVVATVMVLQALEGLSDREAVSALRRDIAWKVACGLRLDDEGFHPTVLVYWRNRIRASARPRRIFEAVRQVVEADRGAAGAGSAGAGLHDLGGRGRDPGHRHPAGRGDPPGPPAGPGGAPGRAWPPTTMTGRASRSVPGTTRRPSRRWCRGWSTTRWRCLGRWPRSSWTPSRPRRSRCWRWSPARTSSRASGQGRWRIARKVAKDRVISTVDPQARHARKTSAQQRDGYKAHIAAEPETGLVTECALTAATAARRAHRGGAAGRRGAGLGGAGRLGLWLRGDPRGAARRRPHPDDQADPAPERGAGRVHHPRLPHRPPGRHGQLPGGRQPRRSPAPARSASPVGAGAARCAGAAPPPRVAAPSTCIPTRTSCAPPAAAR